MRNKLFFIFSALLCLGLAGWAYRTHAAQKLAYTFYLEMAPVDPRALLAGDYMRLSYAFEWGAKDKDAVLCAVQTAGADGSVTQGVLRLDAPGTECVRIAYKNGYYRVPHQFYFQEGTGKKYEAARYAAVKQISKNMFSVVGLADENFRPLK